jgi:hypothetical protein
MGVARKVARKNANADRAKPIKQRLIPSGTRHNA